MEYGGWARGLVLGWEGGGASGSHLSPVRVPAHGAAGSAPPLSAVPSAAAPPPSAHHHRSLVLIGRMERRITMLLFFVLF